MSQQDLAELSGLSVRTISDLERGRTRFPYPDSLARLADALGLSGPGRVDFIAAAGRRLMRAEGTNAAGSGTSSRSRMGLRQLPAAIEHLAHALRAKPVPDPEDLSADIWESDAELAAFLAGLRAARAIPLW